MAPRRDEKGERQGRILVVFNQFPKLSETFLLREVELWEKAGLNTQPVSLLTGEQVEHIERMDAWRSKTVCLARWSNDYKMVEALRSAFNKPRAIATVLAESLLDADRGWVRRIDSLGGWLAGIGLAGVVIENKAVHIHAAWANAPAQAARMASLLTGVSYSVSIHAADFWRAGRMLAPRLLDAEWIVTCNQKVYKELVTMLPEIGKNLFLRPHAIDPDTFFPAERSITGIWQLLSVGRLVEKKGMSTLIQACSLLRGWGLNFLCDIIGDGPMASTLQELIKSLGLTDRVRLLGAREPREVARAMRRHHLFVLASHTARNGDQEGLPNVVMEALLSELPVVVSRTGSLDEIIVSGVTGFVAAAQNPEALARAVLEAVGDYPRALQTARHGRRRAMSRAQQMDQGRWLAQRFAGKCGQALKISPPAGPHPKACE